MEKITAMDKSRLVQEYLGEVRGDLSTIAFFKKSATETLERAKRDYYVDRVGNVRWKSNDSVPPDDILELLFTAGVISSGVYQKSLTTSGKETRKQLEAYRKAQAGREPSREEIFEMKAAFGANAKVVNALTGREIDLSKYDSIGGSMKDAEKHKVGEKFEKGKSKFTITAIKGDDYEARMEGGSTVLILGDPVASGYTKVVKDSNDFVEGERVEFTKSDGTVAKGVVSTAKVYNGKIEISSDDKTYSVNVRSVRSLDSIKMFKVTDASGKIRLAKGKDELDAICKIKAIVDARGDREFPILERLASDYEKLAKSAKENNEKWRSYESAVHKKYNGDWGLIRNSVGYQAANSEYTRRGMDLFKQANNVKAEMQRVIGALNSQFGGLLEESYERGNITYVLKPQSEFYLLGSSIEYDIKNVHKVVSHLKEKAKKLDQVNSPRVNNGFMVTARIMNSNGTVYRKEEVKWIKAPNEAMAKEEFKRAMGVYGKTFEFTEVRKA